MNLIKTLLFSMLLFFTVVKPETQNLVIKADQIEKRFEENLVAFTQELEKTPVPPVKISGEMKRIVYKIGDVFLEYLKARVMRGVESQVSEAELSYKQSIFDLFHQLVPLLVVEFGKMKDVKNLDSALCEVILIVVGPGLLHKVFEKIEADHESFHKEKDTMILSLNFLHRNKIKMMTCFGLWIEYFAAKGERLEPEVATEAELTYKQAIIAWYHENGRDFVEQALIIEEAKSA